MMMRKRTENAHLKVIWVLTQCSNGGNKLYSTHVNQSSEMASSAADPLIVVTDTKYAAIQVLAFLDFFCSAIYSAYK